MTTIRVATLLSFLTAFAFAFGAAGVFMPAASASCAVNLGSCDATANCTVNAGTCKDTCTYLVNVGTCGDSCSGLVNLNTCVSQGSCTNNQPVHTYGLPGSLGGNSNTLTEQGAPVSGASAGFVTVQDSNVADCNGDGVPGDFDGDLDVGVGGGFFGSSTEWDTTDGCGYGLNVHSTSGTATDLSGLPVGGTWGVDDTAGPVVVTDPNTGATVSCQVDGSITPDTDTNDCLNVWVNTWSPGTDPVCAIGHGGDDGYWLFLQSGVTEDGGSVTAATATTGTLAANA